MKKYAALVSCLDYDSAAIIESVKHFYGSRNVQLISNIKPGGFNAGLIFGFNHEDGSHDVFFFNKT